jgi:hypothetical protein
MPDCDFFWRLHRNDNPPEEDGSTLFEKDIPEL